MISSENGFILQSEKKPMLNTSENAFYLAHWILRYFLHARHHCILRGVGEALRVWSPEHVCSWHELSHVSDTNA